MTAKRIIFLVAALLVFTLVYFGLELGLNFFDQEPIPQWKSLSVAGISAAMVLYESFKINPAFELKDLLSLQKTSFSSEASSTELAKKIKSLGYKIVSKSESSIVFKTKWKFREPSLIFTLQKAGNEMRLKARPTYAFHVLNLGKSKQHLVRLEQAFTDVTLHEKKLA